MRRGKPPVNPMALAIGAIVIFALIVFGAFTKRVPFVHGYRVNGVFASSNQLRKGSPVRIAGVTVGKVAGFKPGPGTTRIVTLELHEDARPIRKDATLKIRPRVFLEGGFYVQVRPGTPEAPELPDGGTIPLSQTAIPVQVGDLLSALRHPTRDSLKSVIKELDIALGGGGAEALARANGPLGPALKDTAQIAEAARGLSPHDLSDAIRSSSRLTAATASRESQLESLVTDLNTTSGALADESGALGASIRELDGVMREAPPQLDLIDRALPSLTRFTNTLRPGLRVAPPVLNGLADLLVQVRAASAPGELPHLLTLAEPAVRRLPRLERRLTALFPNVTPVTDCVRDRVAPVLDASLDDGSLSSGRPVWQDLVHALVGAASSGASFDANGSWLRLIGAVGERTVSLGPSLPGTEQLTGRVGEAILGTRPHPLPPGSKPPLRPDAECPSQTAPDLRASTGPPPAQTAAKASGRPDRARALRFLRRLLSKQEGGTRR